MGDNLDIRAGYWTVGEILQWIAIGLLGGAAVALIVWRPWRPRAATVAAASHSMPATTGAAPPAWEQPPSSAPAPQAPDPATSTTEVTQVPTTSGTPGATAAPEPPRPRLWQRRSGE